MADVTLTYKGSDILELSDSGSATLKTGGKYCEDDVTVEYVKPSGVGEDLLEKRILRTLTSYSNSTITSVGPQSFYLYSPLVEVDFPNVTTVREQAFQGTKLTSIFFPNALCNSNSFASCSSAITAVVGKFGSDRTFSGCSKLQKVDICLQTNVGARTFESCSVLDTIIIRSTTICPMTQAASDVFRLATKFLSGGSGGEIYVPEALIDTYKSATNWSTLDGYGTVTWKKIEGSYYETHYADGTVIS